MAVNPVAKGRMFAQVWQAFKQLNPKNVEHEAKRRIRVAIIGPSGEIEDAAAFFLAGDLSAFDQAGSILLLLPIPLDQPTYHVLPTCDIVLYHKDYQEALPGVASERIFGFGSIDDLPDVIKKILDQPLLKYAHLPLARALPAFRPEVAVRTIQTVSIENTLFVTSTSLGNVIPNPLQPLVSVAESLGDLTVLTANQLRMLFILAAVYNKDLGFKEQAPEAMSILGAAFGWRSIARELVGMIPLGAGILPKATIAFAGTWAIGEGIAYYYKTGEKLTKEQLRQRFDEAVAKGRETVTKLVDRIKESMPVGAFEAMTRRTAGEPELTEEAEPEGSGQTVKTEPAE